MDNKVSDTMVYRVVNYLK